MNQSLQFKTVLMFVLIPFMLFAQQRPSISFGQLLELSENEPINKKEARAAALNANEPWSVYIEGTAFIEALAVENGRPVYAVMTNLLDPYDGGYTAFFDDVLSRFDLSGARIIYSKEKVVNPHVGQPQVNSSGRDVSFIMFMESTNDRVVGLDPVTGDVVIASILEDLTNLNTPKVALLTSRATITISDQVSDGVLEYDTAGTARGYFAPIGGVNNTLLDNCRGHVYLPNGNLLVANASGGNANAVVQFDNQGNYIGQFIAAGAGGLDSPYDILLRTGDILVSASSSDALHRYDYTGAFLGNLATSIPFPQQIVEVANGDIYCADFGVGGGVRIYSSTGTLLNLFNVVTANRGVWVLGNGNILTSNAAGVHELNGTTGALVRSLLPGVSGQWFAPYDLSIIPVELSSFNASLEGSSVTLNWITETESNNKGFDVERRINGGSWEPVGFVKGSGTTAEPVSYVYGDMLETPGKYTYRLKQYDFDGSFEYSRTVEVDYSVPAEFALEQNYPNPFNPTTTIKFSIPADQFVSVKVYNLLGKEVARLMNNNLKAGNHEVTFNASGLSSGMYFYKIEAGSFTAVKKMTLLK